MGHPTGNLAAYEMISMENCVGYGQDVLLDVPLDVPLDVLLDVLLDVPLDVLRGVPWVVFSARPMGDPIQHFQRAVS